MKKTFFLTMAIAVVSVTSFVFFEGAVASAVYSSTSTVDASLDYVVRLEVTAEVSLSCPANEVNIGTISGLSGGSADGTATCTVRTNELSGYTLKIAASNTPAMVHDDGLTQYFFGDYDNGSDTHDYAWSNTAATSTFGFAATSTDVTTPFKNDGAACNAGSNISNTQCYRGLKGATQIDVSSSNTKTSVNGTDTIFRFKAEVGATVGQATGFYHATTTITAHAN